MSAAVNYDRRSFLFDGRRELLISGEIHYARAPRELWPALLDRSVECGLNAVAAYTFWGFHEPRRGEYDFSGDRDLGHFLELCRQRGLRVMLRLGPYYCGEWNFGGLPAYLRDEPGIVIRTWNDAYRRRVELFFERLIAVVRPHLATRGGPVVLAQVENEYANVAGRYGAEGQRYLAWLAELTRGLGVDVPLLMCEGAASGVIETVNGFSIPAARWEKFRAQHPDLPALWTEFWTGWYDTWGFQNHRRDWRNMAWHLLQFVSRGGAGWNYYMWYAGTHLGRTSMYLQATAYGFDAPLDEYGRVTEKAAELGRLHRLLRDHTALLLEGERERVVAADGAEETTWRRGAEMLRVRLEPGRAQVTDGAGAVLYDTRSPRPAPASPAWRECCRLENWLASPEPRPRERAEAIRAPQPVEQLRLTRDESDYCWYSTTLELDAAGPVTLEIPFGGDLFYVFLDDRLVGQTQPPFRENRGPTMPGDTGPIVNELERQRDGFRQVFEFAAERGAHRLDILAVALGLVKGDWQIAGPMNTERKGIWQPVRVNGRECSGWEMRPGLVGARAWTTPTVPAPPCCWYQTTFTVSADGDYRLDALGLGKGMLFLNDRLLGRYWLVPGHGYGADEGWQDAALDGLFLSPPGEPTQRYYQLPRSWLRETNTLRLFEEHPVAPPTLHVERR